MTLVVFGNSFLPPIKEGNIKNQQESGIIQRNHLCGAEIADRGQSMKSFITILILEELVCFRYTYPLLSCVQHMAILRRKKCLFDDLLLLLLVVNHFHDFLVHKLGEVLCVGNKINYFQ